MSRNAQLEAPITGDGTVEASYPFRMQGNGHGPGQRVAPAPPPPQWPPYPVPTTPARRWLPVAIIVAAIVIATAVVSAAVIMSSGGKNAPAGSDSNAPVSAPSAQVTPASDSATCEAWKTTKPALDAIPGLPAGWDWNTPNIDTYIANRNAAITRALNLFEPKIAADPANVATAAHNYVDAKRGEVKMLTDHTFTSADAVSVNASGAALNQACGMSAAG